MANARYSINIRVWLRVYAFGREWVVYTLPGVKGEWHPRIAWSRC